MRTSARSCLLASVLLALAQVAVARQPEFPMTDDMRIARLGDSLRVNGNDVNVRTFTSTESAQEIVDFYREEWGEDKNAEPGYTVNNLKQPWTIIARIEDDYLMTVQVQPSDNEGSKGMLAISRLPDRNRAPKLGEGFPSMGGSDVINEVVSKDPGQTGRTMMVGNRHDMATNVDFYRNRYSTGGWSVDMDRSLGGIMHVLAVRKSRRRVNLVISAGPDGGTLIVANEVTHDIL
ncbi:MAG: hypothetical protein ACU85U_13160 [Gammaproteobacteria bacterium]